MLQKLATERNIIYDRAIDAEGHGKKESDGLSGGDKNTLSKEFRGNVEYQPEQLVEHKKSFFMCDMVDGNRVDFAHLCKDVLAHPDRGKKVAPNNPRPSKAASEKSIAKRVYEVREEDAAEFEGLKMKACGFEKKGKGNGMKSMYHFRFDKELNHLFAFCRYACTCPGCCRQLDSEHPDKYKTPRDECYLWPIMEKRDDNGEGTGEGYNDWQFGHFEPREDCDMNQFHASKADTLRNIGKTYAREIVESDFGAYSVFRIIRVTHIILWNGRGNHTELQRMIR